MLADGIGSTPVVPLLVGCGGDRHEVRLKPESCNPTGSAKDQTAGALVRAMHERRPLRPGDVVVESTSGNLGLALARLLIGTGCRFIAVVDGNTPQETRRALADAGAEVVVVNDPHEKGGYLLNRLRTVQELCAANPGYRWSNQYENPANPLVHEQTTGPEILHQVGERLDAVYVAVSTGGTLAGIARYLRTAAPSVRIVAVDAEGSVVLGRRAGRRLLSGIGSSRPSSFLWPSAYDDAHIVADAQSFALCRTVRSDTGLAIGGSGGSVLDAALTDLVGPRPPRFPICLVADGGERYQQTF